MKKYIILAVILFTGTIFAQSAKPVLEPFGKKIKATYFHENGQVQQVGFFEISETNQTNKVPVLGDIPVMGNLFKSRTRETEKREMLVFITPRMVTDAIANR